MKLSIDQKLQIFCAAFNATVRAHPDVVQGKQEPVILALEKTRLAVARIESGALEHQGGGA